MTATSTATAKFEYVMRLGDTALVLSHRVSELCGKGPALEEDMALANVALDLLGQARLWLSYAGEVEARGRDEDALAYLRTDREFRNMLLVEQPNGSYAETIVRQFYFDAWHSLALENLARSSEPRIAEIASKSQKEVAYHLRRSADLVVRLGDGTAESHARMQAAVDALWPFTGELFVGDVIDEEMIAEGIGFDPSILRAPWLAIVSKVFHAATVQLPGDGAWMQKGGKQGIHTEHLGYLLAEMQVVPRTYTGAKW